jgi:hypothetical protein
MGQGPTVRGMRYNCDERWDDMVRVGATEDRFCNSCRKVVIDFSSWRSQDVDAWFKERPDTCGQFRLDQVQRDLVPMPDLGRDLVRGAAAVMAAMSLLTTQAQQAPAPPTPMEQAPMEGTPATRYDTTFPASGADGATVAAAMAPGRSTGNRRPRYYLSKRFPFIHAGRMVRGKRIIGCPSF